MKSVRFTSGLLSFALALGLLLPGASGTAQTPTASAVACRARAVNELGRVHDEFRARIFGSRFDRNGYATALTGGFVEDEHEGILETKGRLTSELVTPIVESYRAYRCRSISVCEAMKQSFQTPFPLTIQPLGCKSLNIESFNECQFTANDKGTPAEESQLISECGQLVETSLQAERAILKLAVAYDSGYRAALQIGGMLEWMQEDLPDNALKPVRDMINLLGKLHEIPCFIAQCDNPDASALAP